jgi:hypothetical protein
MLTDLLLLFVLITLNGIFAMSEIAIVSSKRARLMQMAESGSAGARHALTLASEPIRNQRHGDPAGSCHAMVAADDHVALVRLGLP